MPFEPRPANDEPLSPQETIRPDGMVDELIFASYAAYENQRFASDADEIAPAVIAFHLGASTTLREVWAKMEADVRRYGLAAFADEVARRLDPEGPLP